MNKKYGAWIDRKGNLIEVEEECHFEKAAEILCQIWNTEILSPEVLNKIYSYMYNEKYIRLIFTKDGYKLEYRKDQTITKSQVTWIENASFCDTW